MDQGALDGGEAILQACRDLDVDYIVSSPGSEWPPVWEALARQSLHSTPGPVLLSCAHELLAVDVALGYTLVTGRMQAVLLHAAVGVMQAHLGFHAARLAEVPMLVLSGASVDFGVSQDVDPGAQWYYNHNHAGGVDALVRPLMKWSHPAASPTTLHELVVHAGRVACQPPMGPAHITVPIEVLLRPWQRPRAFAKIPPRSLLQPTADDVNRVADLLLAAHDPLVIAASSGRSRDAYCPLVELAELLALPVVESTAGELNAFPRESALHQGFAANPWLQGADLVLIVGCRAPWYPLQQGRCGATMVVIDDNPFKTHMAWQQLEANVVLGGDVASSLRLLVGAVAARLNDGMQPLHDAVERRRKRFQETHDERQERTRRRLRADLARPDLAATVVASALAEALPEDALYVDETTVHMEVNRTYLRSRGAASCVAIRAGLGQGLGVAMGVKLAHPDRMVVCLVGDGAFMYNPVLPALALARRSNLPILIVVYDNGGYRSMRSSQLSFYPEGLGVRNDLFYGEQLESFDYEASVGLFGGFGARVQTPEAMPDTLRRAIAAVSSGRTALVSVKLVD